MIIYALLYDNDCMRVSASLILFMPSLHTIMSSTNVVQDKPPIQPHSQHHGPCAERRWSLEFLRQAGPVKGHGQPRLDVWQEYLERDHQGSQGWASWIYTRRPAVCANSNSLYSVTAMNGMYYRSM